MGIVERLTAEAAARERQAAVERLGDALVDALIKRLEELDEEDQQALIERVIREGSDAIRENTQTQPSR